MTRGTVFGVCLAVAWASGVACESKTEAPSVVTAEPLAVETGAADIAALETAAAEGPSEVPAKASAEAAEDNAAEDNAAEDNAAASAEAPAEQTEPGRSPSNHEVAKPVTPPKPPPPASKPPPPAGKDEEPKYTGDKPCRATQFDFASTRKACNTGGLTKAKSVMKGMVKRAKDAGKTIDGKPPKCSSCHDNTKTYIKKSNAVSEMRKLL